MLLSELAAQMVEGLELSSVAKSKINRAIRRFADHLQREPNAEDLSDSSISAFNATLESRDVSKPTRKLYRQQLRRLGCFAQSQKIETGWISSVDPLADIKSQGNRRQKFARDTRGPKAKVRRQLAKAATLFAEGSTLAEIAARLNVPTNTLKTWRTRYRTIWNAAYAESVAKVSEGVKAESTKHAQFIAAKSFTRKAVAASKAGSELVSPDCGDFVGTKTLTELAADIAMERSLQPNSLTLYQRVIANVERWAGRTIYAEQFHKDWINRWLVELENSHLAPSTVKGHRVHIISLWNAAFETELVDTQPRRIRRIKVPTKPPQIWPADDIRRMIAQATTLSKDYRQAGMSRSQWWELYIRVAWDTGFRPSEIWRLCVADMDENGVIAIAQNKTGRYHIAQLKATTMRLLGCKGALVPRIGSDEYTRREFKVRILKPLGLRGSLKKFRRSSGADVELQQFGAGGAHLGHKPGSSITREHYIPAEVVLKSRPKPTEL